MMQREDFMKISLMQYKIPTREDIGHIHVEFESSYEKFWSIWRKIDR